MATTDKVYPPENKITPSGWTLPQDVVGECPPPREDLEANMEYLIELAWRYSQDRWQGMRFALLQNDVWSTGQDDLFGGGTAPTGTWPKRVVMNESAELFEVKPWVGRPSLAAPIPTPTASMMTGADMIQSQYGHTDPNRPSYDEAARQFAEGDPLQWKTPMARDYRSGEVARGLGETKHQAGLNNQVAMVEAIGRGDGKLWPTPQHHDSHTGSPDRLGRENGGGNRNLNDEVLAFPEPDPAIWRTPMAADAKNMASASQTYLQDQVKASAVGNLPTPKAGSNRNSRKAIMGGHPNHPSKSDLSLEQAAECLEGVLPREVNDPSELPSRFQALFPTPTAQDGTKPRGPNSHRQHDLSGIAKGYWPTPRAGKVNGEDEEVWRKRQAAGGVSTPPLGLAVKMAPPASLPTPRASEWKGTGPNGSKSQKHMLEKGYLCTVVNEVETNGVPPVTDYPTPRGGGGQGVGMCGGTGAYEKLKYLEAKGAITTEERESRASGSGGQLNPDWVEPLMGYRCTTTTLVPEIEAWFKVDAKRLKAADLKKLHELDEAAVVLEDAVEAEDEPVAPKKEAPRGRKKPKP